MAFEVFDKRKSALGNAPRATLQKKGLLSLNASAHRLIENAASVEILFNPAEKIIALKPSTESHAYAFREVNPDTGHVVISLTAFSKYYGIDTSQRYLIDPKLDEDGEMLLLPIGDAPVVAGT